MRLSFSVLWFDDNEDYFDSLDISSLKEEISEWGFEPNIKQVTTPEEFLKLSPFEIYDLIVVDRNLEGYKDGQEFIADLRSNAIYTEVIFYTAGNTSDLWDAIRDKELEGVFVSSRNNILTKITRVGRQTIRKVLDLENMRGIVMAEVGELDLLLNEIITIGIENLPIDQQKSIFNKFKKNGIKQSQMNIEALREFAEQPTTDSMLSLSDSDKRWRNFNRLCKRYDKLKKEKETLGDYVEDVLKPRNFLAHGKSERDEKGAYLFRYRGKEYTFNNETSLELRRTILRYKNKFFDIIEILN